MAVPALKPREHPILQHSVPLGRNPFRHGSASACQDVGYCSAGDGAAKGEDEVRFGVRGAPDDVENVGNWENRACSVDGHFPEDLRVRQACLAAVVGRRVFMTYVPAVTAGALEQYCVRRTRVERLVSMVGAAELKKVGNRKREDNR